VIHRTLLVSKDGLERAKSLIASYKLGKIQEMNPELWQAKKVVDSTFHPGALVSGEEYQQMLI
jgi:sideroflexin-5